MCVRARVCALFLCVFVLVWICMYVRDTPVVCMCHACVFISVCVCMCMCTRTLNVENCCTDMPTNRQ